MCGLCTVPDKAGEMIFDVLRLALEFPISELHLNFSDDWRLLNVRLVILLPDQSVPHPNIGTATRKREFLSSELRIFKAKGGC